MNNKVVFLVHSLHVGGMERVMVEIANYLSKQNNFEIHFVLYGIQPVIFYDIESNIAIHHPVKTFSNKFRLLSITERMLFIRKKVKQLNPVCILSFGEFWNSFVLISLLGVRKRILISDRCQPNKSLGIIHNSLRSILYPIADCIIAQTNIAKSYYEKMNLNSNIISIGNPIKDFASSKKSTRKKIVLSVGRLIDSKNHDELIKIFSEISIPGWRLVIVGDDAQKQSNYDKLKKLINSLKLNDRVDLLGKQKNMEDIYNEASIFAFTSSSEGFPNVIGEAMTAKLPVVAYDCVAGPSDLILSGKTGFLIPLFDRKAFKEKLEELMSSENLRLDMGENGRNFILNKFSSKEICDKYLKLFMNDVL